MGSSQSTYSYPVEVTASASDLGMARHASMCGFRIAGTERSRKQERNESGQA